MKRFWAAAALLALLLAGSLANAWYARALTEDMGARLDRAQTLAGAGEWEQAARLTGLVRADWEAHSLYFHVVARHSDADGVSKGFRAVEEYLALEETDQYNAANADLIAQLTLLAEMEQPSWTNVL